MSNLVITYTSPHGRQEETKFTTEDTKIDLHMRVASHVDLTPLQDCSRLEVLELSQNKLESINLSPLRDCSTLKQLRLGYNRLSTIDLWQLWNSTVLVEIDLVDNLLEEVNLTPVIQRSKVRLDDNVRASVDNVLLYLLSGNDISRISLCNKAREPMELSPMIQWNSYEELIYKNGWDSTYQHLIELLKRLEKRSWFRAQKGLLEGFRIHELAGYDGNPLLLLEGSENETDYHGVRNRIYDNSIELIEAQIDNEGSTLFLDASQMAGTRASKLLPQIITSREQEIQQVVVPIEGNRVNLMPLWLTHYGNQLLRVLCFGPMTDKQGLKLIENNLQQLDFELRTESGDLENLPTFSKLSEGLKDYVYAAAEINQ
ncbi:MAG: leucine-rich repeat domain-containing protein [Candidatus Thorarchaeota archaeon]